MLKAGPHMMTRVVILRLALVLLHEASVDGQRQSLSLDGEWGFALSVGNQSGSIRVPGSVEAQGFGNETEQMWHQIVTGDNAHGERGVAGIYTKTVTVPTCPPGHTSYFIIDQGIHRHALFRANGRLLGEHTGYLTPFEAELTGCTPSCTIEVTLDGGRPCSPQGPNCTGDCGGCSDALIGAADDDTDGTGLGGWAGLNGHVSIECRPPIFIDGGVGNVIPPHVQHPLVTQASTGKPLEVTVSFTISGGVAPATVHIFDNSTGVPVASSSPSVPQQGNVSLSVTIPNVRLWSPESRALYTAVVTLGATATPLDTVTTRFGVRSVTVDGHKLLLNGRRIFLAGYGDDAIYPMTVSPPRDKSGYVEKLKFAHSHGFNFVRHHSHVLPPEYFDAADEWGIMVSPELPAAYNNYFVTANRTGQQLYVDSWSSYIASYRNHPSVFTWTLLNEYYMGANFTRGGEVFGAERFFQIKKMLDPSRLMMDQDGACSGQDLRDSLSFCSTHMDVLSMGCVGYDLQRNCLGGVAPTAWVGNKYHDSCNATTGSCSFVPAPKIPIISHETGNYNTFPRLQSLVEHFISSGTTIRPYWLSGAVAKLNSSGLLNESEDWALASERLYATCWKLDVEDHRHNPQISGYEWWLIQDYWMGSNGITDTFLRPKPGVAPFISQFNARSILIQDGLLLSYSSRDNVTIDISLSNFDTDLPADTRLAWSLHIDGKSIGGESAVAVRPVPQGSLGVVASIAVQLPDVGTSDSVSFGATDGPKTLTLTAQLTGNAFAARVPMNSWNTTLFPRWREVPSPTTKTPIQVTSDKLLPASRCGFSDCELSTVNPNPALGPAVYLTSVVTSGLVQAVKRGSVVLLLENTTAGFFPTSVTRWKQAWWLGNGQDCTAGTFVYENAARVLGGMAPERFADQSWWRLVNGAQSFLIDEMKALPGSWSAKQHSSYGELDDCQVLPVPVSSLGQQSSTSLSNETWTGPVKGTYGDTDCPNLGCHGGATAPLTVQQCEVLCDKQKSCNAFNFSPMKPDGSGGCCLRSCPAGKRNGPPLNGACCAYYKGGQVGCPAAFPFPSHTLKQICYKTSAEAAAGEGPCGSWCTKDVKVGSGCGANTDHLCRSGDAPLCKRNISASACEALCDADPSCNAINYNRSVGCCLQACSSASLGPPKSTNTSSCCGYHRMAGGNMTPPMVMMRAIDIVGLSRNKALLWSAPVGAGHIVATGLNLFGKNETEAPFPEQAWVVDRLVRYAASLLSI